MMEELSSGIGRLHYFLAHVLITVLMILAAIYLGPEHGAFGILSLTAMIAGVVLDVLRLRSTGVSQWLMFIRFVPYGGLLLWTFLQSAQPGWIETKRFDRAGWSIIATHAILAALLIYLMLRSPGMEFFGV